MYRLISVVMITMGLVFFTQPFFASTWERLQPFKNRADLYSIAMRNSSNGLCVGASGVIKRTSSKSVLDALPTLVWQFVESGVNHDLYDVSYSKLGVVIITGANGTILRGSSDNGPFTPVSSFTSKALRASAWMNNVVVVVGDGGTVLKSVDEGRSFTRVTGVTDSSLIDINVDSQ